MLMENVMERALSEEKHYCANEDYIVREIAGETILVPTGASAEHFNGMLTLNETSRFLVGNCFGMPHTFEETVGSRGRNDIEDDNQSLESDIYDFMKESVMLGFLKEEE